VQLRELAEQGPLAAFVLSHSREPFVAWLGDGRLLAANPRLERLTGYAREELERMRWPDDFAVPEMRDDIVRAMEGPAGDTAARAPCGELVMKNGSRVIVTAPVGRYCPEDGGEPCYFAFIAGAARREDERTALREANARAELYLDLMSHDIDNLHRVSVGYLEMALGTARLSPGERELIRTALGSLANASRLIDNVKRVRPPDASPDSDDHPL